MGWLLSVSEGLIGLGANIVYAILRACISGVDSYVRNVDAAGSNPAKSIIDFVFSEDAEFCFGFLVFFECLFFAVSPI